jgi:hypothetical protein
MTTERERILGLTGYDLDAEVAAKVMEWTFTEHQGPPFKRWFDRDGERIPPCPDFHRDYNACRAMEDELERLGLVDRYVQNLREVIEHSSLWNPIWNYLRAAPQQRCQAALLTVASTTETP